MDVFLRFESKEMESNINNNNNKTVENTLNDVCDNIKQEIQSTEKCPDNNTSIQLDQQQRQEQLTPPSQPITNKISPKSADSTSNKLTIITNEPTDSIRSEMEETSPNEKPNESDDNISNQSLTPISSQQLDEFKYSPQVETVLRQYRFKIPIDDFYVMLEDAVVEEKSSKQYRYLTGDFMRIFERHLEQFEKCKVQIQKRNNIVYDVPSRTSTVYIRINGDCKLCPRSNRVKFVFTIRKKPKGNEKYIDVDTKSRGNHVHNGVTIVTTDITLPSTSGNYNIDSQEEKNSMLVTTTTLKPDFSNLNESSFFNMNESIKSMSDQQMMKQQQFSSSAKNMNITGTNQRKNIPKKRKNANITSSQTENQNSLSVNEDNEDMNLLNTSSASLNNFNEQLQTMITSTPPPPPPLGPPLNHHQSFPSSLRFGSSSNNTLPFPSITTTPSLADRVILSQLANQITSRIMIKLDQINLKVNQISDRLYELERKFENVDLPEFQHF